MREGLYLADEINYWLMPIKKDWSNSKWPKANQDEKDKRQRDKKDDECRDLANDTYKNFQNWTTKRNK